jgi:hypothetical protein
MRLKLGGKALGVSQDVEPARKMRKITMQKVKGRRKYITPNAEEARKKAEEMGEGQMLKLKDGDNRMLILPTDESMELDHNNPWIETFSHFCGGNDVLGSFGIKDRPEDFPMAHACLKSHFQKRCGWCDYRDELFSTKSKRDKKLASDLYPSPRYFANVVVVGKELIVRQVGFPKSVALQLLGLIEEGIFFSDPSELIVVNIKRRRTGKAVMNVEYDVVVNQRFTKGPMREEWDDQIVDLNKFVATVPTNDEIDAALDNLETLAEIGAEVSDVGSDISDYVSRDHKSGQDDVAF